MRIAFRVGASFLSVALLLADAPSPGRKLTTLERLQEPHLAAVHEARLRLGRERKTLPQNGPWHDYRALLHVHAEDADHTKGTRAEVLAAAKSTGASVVMFTDHRGPKPDTWSGLRDGVLFFPGSEDDHLLRFPAPDGDLRFLSHVEETPDAKGAGFLGMEIYNRHADANDEKPFDEYFRAAMKNPTEWASVADRQRRFPDEVFGAGTDSWPQLLTIWDRESATRVFTGIAANDAHKNQTYNGVTFDPYEVSFRSVSTHILALELTPAAVRDALRHGRAYVAHDWLCDPTGFGFTASNTNGVYELGDHSPVLGRTRLTATVPVAATLRILHNGTVVAESTGSEVSFTPTEAGAYRVEAWLAIDGELRPWIYANPIYLDNNPGRGFTLPAATIADDVEVRKGITYAEGPEENANKHKLDLYLPKGRAKFPVLIFLHGGSWRSGDRADYPALGSRFAHEGFGVVVPSYRLLPGSPHPAQVEDAAAAVEWTLRNIEQHGGDPTRIFLSGHSAGGHLAAWVGVDPRFQGKLRGIIAMSGVYDLSSLAPFMGGSKVEPSPIKRIAPGAPPFLLTYCQNDYPTLPKQARDFQAALKAAGIPAELVFVPEKNHITEIVDIHQPGDPTAAALKRFVADRLGAASPR